MSKKNNSDVIKWAGIAAILYLAFNYISGALSSKISFGRPRIKVNKPTWTGLKVEITQPITNNLPVSFPIESFKGEVLYGDKKLSDLMLTNPIVLEANNTSNLTINADLNFENLAGNIADLIQSGEILQSIYLKGFIASSGVVYPFKEKFVLV